MAPPAQGHADSNPGCLTPKQAASQITGHIGVRLNFPPPSPTHKLQIIQMEVGHAHSWAPLVLSANPQFVGTHLVWICPGGLGYIPSVGELRQRSLWGWGEKRPARPPTPDTPCPRAVSSTYVHTQLSPAPSTHGDLV